MRIEENIKSFSKSSSQSTELNSFGYALEPGIFYQLLYNNFRIRTGIGFNYNLSNDFKLNKSGNKLENVNPDWSGMRFSLSAGYEF